MYDPVYPRAPEKRPPGATVGAGSTSGTMPGGAEGAAVGSEGAAVGSGITPSGCGGTRVTVSIADGAMLPEGAAVGLGCTSPAEGSGIGSANTSKPSAELKLSSCSCVRLRLNS